MKYFIPATLTLVLVLLALVMYKNSAPLQGSAVGGCKNTDKGGIKGLSLTS